MLYVEGDTVLSSDWHVLHRNIYWFLPEQRAAVSGAANPRRLSSAEFYDAERQTYRRIRDRLGELIDQQPIRRFIFLGDLVFGLNRGGGARKIIEALHRELAAFFEIFSLLHEHGVERVLILGNHDDFKSTGGAARALYGELFDVVELYLLEPGRLYTHFPLGYSRPSETLRGTSDEKYYRMNKTFARLDKKLLDQLRAEPTTNYHGHIHAGPFDHPVPGVRYQNVALDVLSRDAAIAEHSSGSFPLGGGGAE